MDGLGPCLRFLRKKHKERLAEVAEATGLSVSFLSDVERGRTDPSLSTLEKLAAHWRMCLSEVIWLAEEVA